MATHPADFSDHLLARALDRAANPIYIVDRTAAIVWCNEAYCQLLGQDKDALLRKGAPSLTPTQSSAGFFKSLWQVVLAGSNWMGELQERRPDGSVVHADTVITPLTDPAGRPNLFLVHLHDATQRKVEYDRLWQMANYDRLTNLANRGHFTSSLELILAQSERNRTTPAVLFVDLDNFKAANDLHGHDAGDQVLVQTAVSLRASVRKSDVVARFGGDEFACILDDVADLDAAGAVAGKIVAAISRIELGVPGSPNHVRIGASVGLALYPLHGSDQATLRKAADAAMYEAKASGKNCWRAAGG